MDCMCTKDNRPKETGITDSYVCVDLETTGLNPRTDRIIEIGAVKVRDGKITEEFSSYVNPGRKLEQRIIELTGISDGMLERAEMIDEVFTGLTEFLEDLPLLGHRVLFDFSFLKKAAADRKCVFEKSGMDTLQIARRCLPELEHKSLPFLCEYFHITYNAHRALEDARATHELYRILGSAFGEKAPDLFAPRKLICQVKRDTPVTKAQKERLAGLLFRHGILPEYDIEALTRSEADRIIDRILAEYGRC